MLLVISYNKSARRAPQSRSGEDSRSLKLARGGSQHRKRSVGADRDPEFLIKRENERGLGQSDWATRHLPSQSTGSAAGGRKNRLQGFYPPSAECGLQQDGETRAQLTSSWRDVLRAGTMGYKSV